MPTEADQHKDIDDAVSPASHIVIIGATSAIAEHCARLWVAQKPRQLSLVARDQNKLARIAADLKVRSPESRIAMMGADFHEPARIGELARRLAERQDIDIVLIAHGSLPDQFACESDIDTARAALVINGVSPALFAEAFARHLQMANCGTLAVIGSVAGDRGRKSNYVYGAAKGLIDRYVQGLQHRFAATQVSVCLIKPGPTETPMTALLPPEKRRGLAPVAEVAKTIVDGIDEGRREIYVPPKWRLIMAVIRNLPHFIFKRMDI